MLSKNHAILAILSVVITGCASVPMETSDASAAAKQFNPPSEGNSGLYVYRAGGPGQALKKDVWVDNVCLGETAPNVFFYKEVKGGEEHKISTESEFSPNDLTVKTESGKNYFVNQYMKMGLFVGGAGLEQVDENQGKKTISSLELAKSGTCSK